jgi:hypothetical protein
MMRKGRIAALMTAVAVVALCTAQPPGASAREWKDSECERDRGDDYEICTDGESVGVFWDDGSYINGYCENLSYDFDYKGMSKAEAVAFAKEVCR